ncbi:hypothetical protein TVAG_509770 [Trichomonas vaginalis G3]|uniref:Uncharacterized protein n=1 Tax=Trichomonas vaginalis (strain ATCC PRA-98 / G3) TaxID=412133 RepID=A2G9D9_TRIV3|nr:hypothetical protein TVAGG3_0786630 [Trichomonas vaginalis G3]EAX86228.1 hypothetical protein TVAG_509770 [Trichomonas vaginalis G3]KAI5495438.1 hypothetical protein TVAGG3_0786630 [Trichomonas vaginalis G3]|eukprot:XP_001299158.1 hypothetical protein [Trichomonas vaginalis G3]
MQSKGSNRIPDGKNHKNSKKGDEKPEVLSKKQSNGSTSRHKLSVNRILESQQQMRALEASNGKLHVSNTGVIEINQMIADNDNNSAANSNFQTSPSNAKHFGTSKYLETTSEDSQNSSDFTLPEAKHQKPKAEQNIVNYNQSKENDSSNSPETPPKKAKASLPKPPPEIQKRANQRSRQLKYASSISAESITNSNDNDSAKPEKENWNHEPAESIRQKVERESKASEKPKSNIKNSNQENSKIPNKVITKPKVRKHRLSRNNNSSTNSSNNVLASPNNKKENKNTFISASSSNQSIPSLNSEDAPLREPTKPLRTRSRRSPVKKKPTQKDLNDDEKPIPIDDDSDDEKEKSAQKRNLYFFSEASDEHKQQKLKSNRPAPLVTSFPSRNKKTREINAALTERNEQLPPDRFVLTNVDALTKNGPGKDYIPPDWNISCVKIPAPNDATYIHKKQSTYSMSSIMNGVKRT